MTTHCEHCWEASTRRPTRRAFGRPSRSRAVQWGPLTEKIRDRYQVVHASRRRQRFENLATVAHRLQAAIQDTHQPFVARTADEPAQTLLEFRDGRWDHERAERIAARLRDQRGAGSDDRVVRWRER